MISELYHPEDFLKGNIKKKFINKIIAECQKYGADKLIIEISLKKILEGKLLQQEYIQQND